MATLEAEDGGDPTKAVINLLERNREGLGLEAINYWFEQSQLWLEEAAQQRAEIDSQGLTGREKNALFKIQQSAVPPAWVEEENVWAFSYPHAGAIFQEFGSKPHEIRARRAEYLAFEWPDAPQKIKDQFEHTEGDLVFFESIDHPGIPAIGFVRKGRDRTKDKLREAGVNTEEFGERGG